VVRIAEMPGRLRSYDLRMTDGARHTAVGIAVSRRCDCWWRWREVKALRRMFSARRWIFLGRIL